MNEQEQDHYLARATKAHSMYDKCDGALIYLGEFPSDVVPDVDELVFKCKKCGEAVTLV